MLLLMKYVCYDQTLHYTSGLCVLELFTKEKELKKERDWEERKHIRNALVAVSRPRLPEEPPGSTATCAACREQRRGLREVLEARLHGTSFAM